MLFRSEIEDVIPSDRWYPVSAVSKLKIGDFLKMYCTPISVEKYGRPSQSMIKDMSLHSGLDTGYEYRDLGSFRVNDNPISPDLLLTAELEVAEHIL